MAQGGDINFDPRTGTDKRQSLDDLKSRLESTRDGIETNTNPWPQTMNNPEFAKSKGFLPPVLISPTVDIDDEGNAINIKRGEYEFEDWLGQKISNDKERLTTNRKFNESTDISNSDYRSMRDYYLLHDDSATDYFKHGLQIIDNLKTLNGSDGFSETPFENNDPVMFGFEIIIDDISSPLLNGSVNDFINNYSSISEIESKGPVYEDFKNQFIKFFKTKTNFVRDNIQQEQLNLSRTNNPDSIVSRNRSITNFGQNAYMNYYIQNITGLSNLIETNKPGSFNSMVKYREDLITLSFLEDVSLSLGTLSHLYKLLYWSKPNGKSLIPENLLRFNCDIIVSEVRNFNRVRTAVENNELQILKDNLSRYVYTLNECQLFFDQVSHGDSVNLGDINKADNTTVTFDYKYVTSKFERFVPDLEGFGTYKGYDNGAIWKIGAPGSTRDGQTSVPNFYTEGENKFNENGVDEPVILDKPFPDPFDNDIDDLGVTDKPDLTTLEESSNKSNESYLKKLKNRTIDSAKSEFRTAVNIRAQLLSRTINKALISLQGGTISPPTNVYTSPQPGTIGNLQNRFFYDLRGDLVGFLGNSLSNSVNGTNP
jgi:hypothetical protein